MSSLKLTKRQLAKYKPILNLFSILEQDGFYVEDREEPSNWLKKDYDIFFNLEKNYVEFSKFNIKKDQIQFGHKVSLLTSEESFKQLLMLFQRL